MAKKRKREHDPRSTPSGEKQIEERQEEGKTSSLSLDGQEKSHHERWFTVLLWFVAGALTFWAFGYTILRGSDLWWHIAGGEYIFENLGLPVTDPWSYTAADSRWVVDAWLTEVVLYLWSRFFGLDALAWWKWLVIVGTFLSLMRLLWRLTGSLPAAYFASFLAVAVAAPFMDIRPQLMSLLFFSILLNLTLSRKTVSVWLVPLFFLWANFHAGFTLGLLVLPIVLYPFVFDPDTRKRTLIIAGASVLACLVNPNGVYSFTQPILYALQTDSPFKGITEWHPPFAPGGIQSPVYPYAIGGFAFSLVVIFVLLLKKKIQVDWRPVLIGILTLAMSLTSRRFISLFAISQSLLLATVLAGMARRVTVGPLKIIFPVAALVTGATLLSPYPQRSYAFRYMTAEFTFPVASVDVINENELSGKLFVYYNWGGYVHLKTKGRMKVFIDGRASAVFDADTYTAYLDVLYMRKGWIETVESSGAEYFLWPVKKRQQAVQLLKTDRWKQILRDGESELLVRKSVHHPQHLRTAPGSSIYSDVAQCRQYLKKSENHTADACLRKLLERDPTNFLALHYLLIAQISMEKFDEAKNVLQTMQRVYPQPTYQAHMAELIRSEREKP